MLNFKSISFICFTVFYSVKLMASLHDLPVVSGSIDIRLFPTESVQDGSEVLVSFGVPFPKGSIYNSDLSKVKGYQNGVEIPLSLAVLGYWESIDGDNSIDKSIRSLRIQVKKSFVTRFPEHELLRLEWGISERKLDLAEEPVRNGWHLVDDEVTATGGPTFGPAHQVYEPKVFAVLPREWLAKSGLKSPMSPMSYDISMLRVAPFDVADSMSGYNEADQAQVNFFYTSINEDATNESETSNNTNPFAQGDYEPWLYDRASAFFVGYLRTGDFRFLREAVRSTDYYKSQLYSENECGGTYCRGAFKLKNPDPYGYIDSKYSYNESLALSYWLTGDGQLLPKIEDVTNALEGEPTTVNPSNFTERKAALKWLANIVAFEITGKEAYRQEVVSILDDFRVAQQNPPQGAPNDGGLWHPISAHEGINSDESITSPWMSALLVDAALRVAMISENSEVDHLVSGLASHICGVGSYSTSIRDGINGLANYSGGDPLRFPHYLATTDGLGWSSTFDPYGNYEHAFDTAAIAAWGRYFAVKNHNQQKATELSVCANELYTTFSHVITHWTRPSSEAVYPGYDAYRLVPPRKYNWWFKNSSGFQWAMLFEQGNVPPVNSIPMVSILEPIDFSLFNVNELISIRVNAEDIDGSINLVEIWANETRLADSAIAPFEFEVSFSNPGIYEITVTARDNEGAISTSEPVTLTIMNDNEKSSGGAAIYLLLFALISYRLRIREPL